MASSIINKFLAISSIVCRPPTNVRLAQFKSVHSDFLLDVERSLEQQASQFEQRAPATYSLPADPGDDRYEIFRAGAEPDAFHDSLWESAKPTTMKSGHSAPCVFSSPAGGTQRNGGSFVVAITVPALGQHAPDLVDRESYVLVGRPASEDHIYSFVSEPLTIEQGSQDKTIHVETRLDTQSTKPFISAFRGTINWRLEPARKEKRKRMINVGFDDKESSPFMEFFILGDNIPAAYSDWGNTLGIPIYLLRMLLPDNQLLSISDYRTRAVEWAFTHSRKVYGRFRGLGTRYNLRMTFTRSEHFTDDDLDEGGAGAAFGSDKRHRFFVDWYLLESLSAAKRGITDINHLPRVNCADQASIVALALDLSLMTGEPRPKILTVVADYPNTVKIDGRLVGYPGRCNNAIIMRESKTTPIDKDLLVDPLSPSRSGFAKHFLVSVGDAKGGSDLIYDATVAAMDESQSPVYIAGVPRRRYMEEIIQTKGAEMGTEEGGLFFRSPRYSLPSLDLTS